MAFLATYLGSSGWLLELGSFRILVDPWLTGALYFSPGPWLIEGKLKRDIEKPVDIDLILLTQGLPDHAHPASLRLFPKATAVIGSLSACKVAKSLGFQNVLTLEPGEETKFKDINIRASVGAPVPQFENGYLITSIYGSIYIEPHGFLDSSLPSCELDAVITPVLNLGLPIVGDFIKGNSVLPELINRFKPLTVLARTTGGDADFKGILNRLIKTKGSPKIAADFIGEKSTFIDPKPCQIYKLNVRSN